MWGRGHSDELIPVRHSQSSIPVLFSDLPYCIILKDNYDTDTAAYTYRGWKETFALAVADVPVDCSEHALISSYGAV